MEYEYENADADQFRVAKLNKTKWVVDGEQYDTFAEMNSVMRKRGWRYRQRKEGDFLYKNIALAWFLQSDLSDPDVANTYYGDIENAWSFGLRRQTYPFCGFESDPDWNSDKFRDAVAETKAELINLGLMQKAAAE